MTKLQTQGVHHITLVGADRQTSIDFWQGVLGMPFVFEQPNLDDPETNHLYFDPGDGRLITVFTREDPSPIARPNPMGIGNLHHLAFIVSRATYTQAKTRLEERGFANSGEIDRGFMYSHLFPRSPGPAAGARLLQVRAARRRHSRRRAARGPQHPRRGGRLQHRRRAPGRRHRAAVAQARPRPGQAGIAGARHDRFAGWTDDAYLPCHTGQRPPGRGRTPTP